MYLKRRPVQVKPLIFTVHSHSPIHDWVHHWVQSPKLFVKFFFCFGGFSMWASPSWWTCQPCWKDMETISEWTPFQAKDSGPGAKLQNLHQKGRWGHLVAFAKGEDDEHLFWGVCQSYQCLYSGNFSHNCGTEQDIARFFRGTSMERRQTTCAMFHILDSRTSILRNSILRTPPGLDPSSDSRILNCCWPRYEWFWLLPQNDGCFLPST